MRKKVTVEVYPPRDMIELSLEYLDDMYVRVELTVDGTRDLVKMLEKAIKHYEEVVWLKSNVSS